MHRRPSTLALLATAALCGPALAQSSDRPWSIGVSQAFTYQSNVFNNNGNETSDTVSSTSLRGGLNLPFGRQRAYARASVSHQRYSDISQRNNTGYLLDAGLDWSTIERLSGNVSVLANRQQVDFNRGGIVAVTPSNIESSRGIDARIRLGVVTMLAFEAGAGHRRVSFSAPEFAPREYEQNRGRLGITYRPSGILTLGAGVSGSRTDFLAAEAPALVAERNERQDVYATATWVPTGASTVNARVSVGKSEYQQFNGADFDGVTGSLVWNWKPTGLLALTTTLARDTGLETGFLRLVETDTISATDFSRVTNSLSVAAAYELTGKIGLTGGVSYARRSVIDRVTNATGTDNTTLVSIGARYAATRTISLGCDASREARSSKGAGSSDFDSDRVTCFGQLTLD